MVPDGDARNKCERKKSTGQSAAAFSCNGGFKSSLHGQPKCGSVAELHRPLKFLHPEQMEPKTLYQLLEPIVRGRLSSPRKTMCDCPRAETRFSPRRCIPPPALKSHPAFPPPSHLHMFALLRQLYRRGAIRLDFLDAPVTDDTYTPDGHISGAATLASSYRLSVSTCDMLTPSCV